MKVKFWGVRGSIPTPGPDTVVYGGNTTCIEVVAGETNIILDCGTGIRELGNHYSKLGKAVKVHVFLSHSHWDHIQGFPFFTPIYRYGNEIHIYGPAHPDRTIKDLLMLQMDGAYFPARYFELAAKIIHHDIREESLDIDEVTVHSRFMNHPIYTLGYRIHHEGKVLVYTSDNEPYSAMLYDNLKDFGDTIPAGEMEEFIDHSNQRLVDFVSDADVVIADAMYRADEYPRFRGWGHSSSEHAMDLAIKAGVKKLVVWHHDPNRSDSELEKMCTETQELAKKRGSGLVVVPAREKETIEI
ncbi:MAG: MBL fold metallo-hydrolase [Planctomycetes bacterium]|nr:MBL fold metallo-hydrolase [Planctomycetota bacterium]